MLRFSVRSVCEPSGVTTRYGEMEGSDPACQHAGPPWTEGARPGRRGETTAEPQGDRRCAVGERAKALQSQFERHNYSSRCIDAWVIVSCGQELAPVIHGAVC
jgi:hypothetical protein